MKTWQQKISFLLTSGVVYLGGEYLRGQWFLNTKLDFLCHPYLENGKVYCHSLYQNTGFVFIAAGQMLAIAGIILLFANEAGVRAWWRMSRSFIPLAILAVVFFPPLSPLSLLSGGTPNYEVAVQIFGFVYIISTLVLVVRSRIFHSSQRTD